MSEWLALFALGLTRLEMTLIIKDCLFPRQRRKTLCFGKCAWTHVTCSPSLMTCCTSSTPRSCTSSRKSRRLRTSWINCLRLQESKVRRPVKRCWTRSTVTCLTFCSVGRTDQALCVTVRTPLCCREETCQVHRLRWTCGELETNHCVTWFRLR